jgi:hypothetical protein
LQVSAPKQCPEAELKKLAFIASGLLAANSVGDASSEGAKEVRRPIDLVIAKAAAECLPRRRVVEIREADPAVDMTHHNAMRDAFIVNAPRPNTTILLGPNVVLDFSAIEALPIQIGSCVTIRSVARFGPSTEDVSPTPPGGVAIERAAPRTPSPTPRRGAAGRVRPRPGETGIGGIGRPTEVMGDPGPPPPIPDARSSNSLGPLLKFGPHRQSGDKVFLEINCGDPNSQADHVRISGFRLHGPSFGQQDVGDKGILVHKCVDIEISNMDVAGWGGEAIRVQDDANEYPSPQLLAEPWQLRRLPGACREPPYNGPNGRIGSPNQVRIFNNYIHNNQQPRSTFDGHAGGYGVEVTYGAYAQIYQNVFAYNRHSIAAGGTMGGYEATRNLVLRYGGVHYNGVITVHTHAFDIHGTGDNGFGGFAGTRTTYSYNAFQYGVDNAIAIRGSPWCGVEISNNVFPHHGLEDDWGADAVKLEYRQDLDIIKLGPNNTLDYNSYGKYAVCDFDGDGIDDLFLPTGVSWWFSGMGEFPWRFLSVRNERLEQLRFGYFDADNRCDVLTESNGAWMISSGGTGAWYRLGQNYAPLNQVQFGRFDPNSRDHRPGRTRRTTHAFWRTPSGQWKITTLTGSNQGWRDVQNSRLPMNELRFGDFDGDGVTDVLSVQSGRWAFSPGAAGTWQPLNQNLGDGVRGLYVADIDNNNKDDLIRLQYAVVPVNQLTVRETYTWQISYDGRTSWQPLKIQSWIVAAPLVNADRTLHVFAGRFGTAPGAGILTVDRGGTGRFYAPLETRVGAAPDRNSTFSY